ncbi:unnamed protein product, partial [Phaeothamnion confervicola]
KIPWAGRTVSDWGSGDGGGGGDGWGSSARQAEVKSSKRSLGERFNRRRSSGSLLSFCRCYAMFPRPADNTAPACRRPPPTHPQPSSSTCRPSPPRPTRRPAARRSTCRPPTTVASLLAPASSRTPRPTPASAWPAPMPPRSCRPSRFERPRPCGRKYSIRFVITSRRCCVVVQFDPRDIAARWPQKRLNGQVHVEAQRQVQSYLRGLIIIRLQPNIFV